MKTSIFLLILSFFVILSCSKKMEEEHLYVEDNTPIDTTVVDSVVGQASFSEINAAIENAKKPKDSFVAKKDSSISSKDKLKALEEKLKKEKELNEKKAKELEEKKKKEATKPVTTPEVKQNEQVVENQETKL